MGDRPQLYLVDGNNYVFRAYHAIRALSNSKGVATNAVYGFVQMLLKLIDEEQPEYLAVVFDPPGPTFRRDIYAEYKANRPPAPPDLVPQFGLVREVVNAFRLPLIEIPGFEADDSIATMNDEALEQGYEVVIVSSDKDLAQLVGQHTTMLDTMSERRYTPDEVKRKWGVAPQQMGDFLALIGDSSDNIPGVRGVGPKTAATLLDEYGDLDGIYRNIEQFKGKRRQNLDEDRAAAYRARTLVALRRDVPVGLQIAEMARREPDSAALATLFGELEFRRLRERYAAAVGESGGGAARDGGAGAGEQAEGAPPERAVTLGQIELSCRTVTTEQQLDEMVESVRASGRFAFDLETTSLVTVEAEIVGVAVAARPDEAFYVPVAHFGLDVPEQIPLEVVLRRLGPILSDPGITRYAQNLKYDEAILHRYGVEVGAIAFDPMLASYLYDGSVERHGLDALALRWLGHRAMSYEEVAGKGGKEIPFAHVPVARATVYACEDAAVTLRLVDVLQPRLEECGLIEMLQDLELPLSRVLGRMELCGISVLPERLRELSRRLGARMADLETKAHEAAGVRFNPGSPKQLAGILFDRLGLTPVRRTKSGPSTDSTVLESLKDAHPLPGVVLEWRQLQKLRSTYADTLPAMVNPRTGRLHTSFHQAVAATGRLSSSRPNMQNIPIRSEAGREIRRAFAAPSGHLLLSADYSQIELRVLAHLSEDPSFIHAFEEDQDIHSRTAAEVYGVPLDQVSREQRDNAKAVNFGIVYGMGAQKLARQLSIPRAAARDIIARYFARYSSIKGYFESTVAAARETGEVRTLLGRRRKLPGIDSKNGGARATAERMAINTPVQGSAADIIKLAMLRVHRALSDSACRTRMLLQVHDELLFEVPEEEIEEVTALVREAMEGAYPLRVPLKTEVHSGRDWSEAHG